MELSLKYCGLLPVAPYRKAQMDYPESNKRCTQPPCTVPADEFYSIFLSLGLVGATGFDFVVCSEYYL